ncbi:hypothetical protein AVEN_241461-1 [Araneus ventricosus]|uniref:Uncharacterized protein n=1 Tax=Araneus ventricosus TaxID=182803 RepID=A0A4Y2QQ00_ARAVE|nr:hypothetical protein AVEN_241461-1 [Araneus ventricosus]
MRSCWDVPVDIFSKFLVDFFGCFSGVSYQSMLSALLQSEICIASVVLNVSKSARAVLLRALRVHPLDIKHFWNTIQNDQRTGFIILMKRLIRASSVC